MKATLKRIIKSLTFKHMNEEDRIAWKGFLIGIIISTLIVFPIFILVIMSIFEEYTVLDEMLYEYIKVWFS